ncbi:hypothetical protein [Microbacterium maritypicum]|uniref:hypothetical protein n=1 Tax=Microbacterium maritypicum TaxID=33918 RepID=UPI003D7199C8
MAIDPIVSAGTQVNPQFWLNAANQAIRTECGWHVAPIITEELVLDGTGGKNLLVPSLRIREVVSVKSDGREVTDEVKFSRRAGVLTLASGWSCEVGSIELTIRHGFDADEVPNVAALIVTLTKRAASSSAFVQQAVGPASAKLATGRDGAALGVPLMESEKDTLAPYRLNWGS